MKTFQVLAALSLLCLFYGNCNGQDDIDAIIRSIGQNIGAVINQCLADVKNEISMQENFATHQRRHASGRSYFFAAHLNRPLPFISKLGYSEQFQLKVFRAIKIKFGLSKKTVREIFKRLHKILSVPHNVFTPAAILRPQANITECPFPDDSLMGFGCNSNMRFRTIDGSCNNLKHPTWGRALTPFQRFIWPDYADGFDAPRVAVDGSPLPSARKVSLAVSKGRNRASKHNTVLMAFTGQFLDHDLTRTAASALKRPSIWGQSALVDIDCGIDGCNTVGPQNQACLPIPIHADDPDFNETCLMFVRSAASPQSDCNPGPREQVNQITAYLDASQIYGSSFEEHFPLRNFSQNRGRLRMESHPHGFRNILPFHDDPDCRNKTAGERCFLAGDSRVNEQPGLTTLHTIWVRYHNEIEAELFNLNPHWNGNQLFNETRKIIGAIWQYIIFNEYLPVLLGPDQMKIHQLDLQSSGFSSGYNAHLNPSIRNSFATAAFRVGHSMISDDITVFGKNGRRLAKEPLSNEFENPELIYKDWANGDSPIDGLLRGQYCSCMQKVDRKLSQQLTSHLFALNPPHGTGTDLFSLNTQRSRDHGIPGYTKWRDMCGMTVPRKFGRLTHIKRRIRRQFSKIYNHVDDIDLFAAGISEKPVPGGLVGPTFACIIGRQFHFLKFGDRFWHERDNSTTGFTLDQLGAIRNATFARVICDTSDDIDKIQPWVLLKQATKKHDNVFKGKPNFMGSCDSIPMIDLHPWQEIVIPH